MRLAPLLCALAFPAGAQSDFGQMTGPEKAAFGAEIRDLLMDEPGLVDVALRPVPYVAEANQQMAADLALIGALSDQILQGAAIALFIGPDCDVCDRAVAELDMISKDYGATFTLHDVSDSTSAALAERLKMDTAPFYVLPDMILRGHIPQIVIGKYLARP